MNITPEQLKQLIFEAAHIVQTTPQVQADNEQLQKIGHFIYLCSKLEDYWKECIKKYESNTTD